MGADQIAELRPPIAEVFDGSLAREAWCAAFSVAGHTERWIEVTRDRLNVAYPRDVDPSVLLRELPLPPAFSLQLKEWEPCKFATFSFDENLTPRDLARIVDVLFEDVLGCAGLDYSVDVELFRVAP